MSSYPKRAVWTVTESVLIVRIAGLATVLFGALMLLAVLPAIAPAEPCPNEAVRTGASAALPDCRAYELVTPPYKNGGNVAFRGVVSDEETVTFGSVSGFGGAESGEGLPAGEYVDERGAGGWVNFAGRAVFGTVYQSSNSA